MSIITHFEYGMLSYEDPIIIPFTTSGSTSTAAAVPHGRTVELYASEDCYIAFGSTAPTAASTTHSLTAKTAIRYTMHGDTYIAARGMINSGTLKISTVVLSGGA
jgi:hypothetical protein